MPNGGRLLIHTANVSSAADFDLEQPPIAPGEYVMLLVKDSGMGMDAETRAHIFEPFFTTKEHGKGTGLGLATVYGFVKQSGGYIWVSSEPGAGTTFTIYLPKVHESATKLPSSTVDVVSRRGVETVLLVEDEASLRMLTRNILEESGYTVLEAGTGVEAIDTARNYLGPIHLLLTDMVMPGMSGQAVGAKLALMRPGIRVLYMSGYTGFEARGLADLEAVVIPKPFRRDVLLDKLREALDFEAKAQRSRSESW
jgi:CheY-like chemotaxis protein